MPTMTRVKSVRQESVLYPIGDRIYVLVMVIVLIFMISVIVFVVSVVVADDGDAVVGIALRGENFQRVSAAWAHDESSRVLGELGRWPFMLS